ncbi:FG-GAP repeat protein [Geminisphaera colitermitum]|uniref:FG-GAP repeat protein n=1 Tax=Geminisphaera colitermitum TaxID=1148786 RepID=UPI0001964E69|nr:FG-GAP repeat protein [Geminisphaera colitermitum]
MKIPKTNTNTGVIPRAFLAALAAAALAASPHKTIASTLTASDGSAGDYFGLSVSSSADNALVGAVFDDDKVTDSGSAYYFKGLNDKSGIVYEDVKLLASDGAAYDRFGSSVSLSADNALVGAHQDDDKGSSSGSAYYFKGLNDKSGIVNEDVKLLASDGAANDHFGISVSMLADHALVGAYRDGDMGAQSGSAYYFKGLNDKSGIVYEDVKLLASDGAASDWFSYSVSLSADNALVGAYQDDDKGADSGSAYYFKGLNAKSGIVYQDVKLLASDGAKNDNFGWSLSLSADNALVGARCDDDKGTDSGSAYYFKGLNAKSGTVYQNVKLLASDGATTDYFGHSVSLSADNALVGAHYNSDKGDDSGSVYYFNGLNAKSGTVYQDVKLRASDGAAEDHFGSSVSMDGNRFVIGAYYAQVGGVRTGKAYYGDIRAFTTLDAGDASLATDGLSFVSNGVWAVGGTTSNNTVTLSAGDSATINGSITIGYGEGSNNNALVISGAMSTPLPTVYVGAPSGSTGNRLIFDQPSSITPTTIYLCDGSELHLKISWDIGYDNFAYYGRLIVRNPTSGNYEPVFEYNQYDMLTVEAEDGYLVIRPKAAAGVVATAATLGEPSISGNTVTMDVLGTVGNYYALYASQDLLGNAASWSFVNDTAGQIATDGTATVTFTKSAATAEFYRLVTSATALDGTTINADAKYSSNVAGRYAVTIPANGLKTIAHQLISSKTTVQQLFAALPNRSSVNVQNIETGEMYPASTKAPIGSTWSSGGDRVVQSGYAVVARNGSTSVAVTLDFVGIVPVAAKSYTIVAGRELLMGVQYPVAVSAPEDVNYVIARLDRFNKQNGTEDAYTSYAVSTLGRWSAGGAPAFGIGEGFYFTGNTSKTWEQPALILSEDSIEIE